MEYLEISELLGQTLVRIEKEENSELRFYTDAGKVYRMYHSQDCCESVYLEDVAGELHDLLNSPITLAEEVTNRNENPEGMDESFTSYAESFTWTFYKLATVNGYVTLRWYGESNGYYSESVDFQLIAK